MLEFPLGAATNILSIENGLHVTFGGGRDQTNCSEFEIRLSGAISYGPPLLGWVLKNLR